MKATGSSESPHRWQFFRSGGFDQVALGSADDLRHLHELDPKLWTALACPTEGLEFDAQMLSMLDANRDGRISVREVLDAVDWSCRRLVDPQVMFAPGPLALSSILTTDAEGATLHAAAQRVLASVGKPAAPEIGMEDFADMTRLFSPDHFNGDGVVPKALAEAEGLADLVQAIIETQGPVTDRSGAAGVNRATAQAFFEQSDALLAWRAQAQQEAPTLLPLGAGTADALAAVEAVATKVEDYFTRCRLAAFDSRAATALNPATEAYAALSSAPIAADHAAVEALPLAAVEADAPLPLHKGLNPAWAARIEDLRLKAIEPALGPRKTLSAQDWQTLRAKLSDHAAWRARQPQTPLAALDTERLETLLGENAPARLAALISRDEGADASATTIDALRRLVHYRNGLVTLLRNFVALSDFYAPGRRAIFQVGTLFLDRRSCDLVLRVADLEAHAKMAPLSHCFLIYCKVERADRPSQHIVAALTAGSSDELMVPGRHGVFVDRAGLEWHATVVKVVEQPVSIRQAFFTPYRRAAAFVESQIRNFASAKDKESDHLTKSAVGSVAQGSTKTSTPFDIARFAGIFAALGLAVGAIGTALSAAITGLFQLAWWQLPLAVLGALLVISGPSMLLAWLKLRRRNLGPLLDANGWAVNARALINLPFGRSLTAEAQLPPKAARALGDPYAERRHPWGLWIALLLGAALLWWVWASGVLRP